MDVQHSEHDLLVHQLGMNITRKRVAVPVALQERSLDAIPREKHLVIVGLQLNGCACLFLLFLSITYQALGNYNEPAIRQIISMEP